MTEPIGVPAYQRVADGLRRLMREQKMKPGDQLPPLPKVEEMFGVSNNVARRGVALLAEQGAVRTGAGQGTFVVDPDAVAPPSPEFAAIMRRFDDLQEQVRALAAELAEVKRRRTPTPAPRGRRPDSSAR